MPNWVTPDKLTLVGMVGAAMVFAGYVSSNIAEDWLWLSIAGYIVQWFVVRTDGRGMATSGFVAVGTGFIAGASIFTFLNRVLSANGAPP